jgi:hypothetical protein
MAVQPIGYDDPNADQAMPGSMDPMLLQPPTLPLSIAARRNGRTGVPVSGPVLTKALAAASGVPANAVDQAEQAPNAPPQPDAPSALPNAREAMQAQYGQRRGQYQSELDKLQGDPDYSQYAKQAKQQGNAGLAMNAAAMFAAMGPKDMQGMQEGYQHMGAQLLSPTKIEGGTVDAAGNVMLDPGYKRQKRIEVLERNISTLDTMEQRSVDNAEKAEIARQRDRESAELRRLTLQGQQQAREDRKAYQQSVLDLRRDAADAKRGDGKLSVEKAAQIEDRMADDFTAKTKNYVTELDAARKILTLAPAKWSPIEQQSAIVMLNKILDPNSVVREGEFDRVAKAQGVFQRAQLALTKLTSGETLSPALMKDIRNVAEFYSSAAQRRMDMIAGDYHERATRRGLDSRNVVGMYLPKHLQPGAAQPGGAPVVDPQAPVAERKAGYLGQ